MKVYAIVVTYNGRAWINKCLASLENSSIPVKTIVIDNASTDDTIDIIEQNFPSVHLLTSKENLGFGKANNIGLEIAIKEGADYTFLLNQDAWVEGQTIERLIEVISKNKNFGIVSPIHYNGSGKALDSKFRNYLSKENSNDLNQFINSGISLSREIYEVKFVNAAAWLVSRRCIEKVGGFDPLFYHYGEDNDYLTRARYHGFSLGISSDAKIYHDREGAKNKSLTTKQIVSDKYRYCLLELKDTSSSFGEKWSQVIKNIKDEMFFQFPKRWYSLYLNLKLLALLFKNKKRIINHKDISLKEGASFLNLAQ